MTFKVTFAVWVSDALPPKICVHPPQWSASSTVRWRSNARVINNTGGSRHWLITVTVQLTQQAWLYGSLLMTHTVLHARCAIVMPSATMRVQNYAASGINRGSRWKCSSGWHAICLRYSYNWYRASRGSLGDSWASCNTSSCSYLHCWHSTNCKIKVHCQFTVAGSALSQHQPTLVGIGR